MSNETATSAVAGILRPRNTDLVDEIEAAEILDVVVGTLQVWRSTGRYGIPFIKVGRKVRYSRTALNAWLESRTRSSGATA
ncbi:MAG: helix-turn-helix domain-containing protein [Rhodocyclaceae bacterium]|nr:helix-turn-helix domain-containing protein [Rhodocyclaceae bacterium]